MKNIHIAKVKYFAAQAKALDIAEMEKISLEKRYTIWLCFIHNNMIKALDYMITMSIKRIGKIHNKAKENLELMLDSQRGKIESMIELLSNAVIHSKCYWTANQRWYYDYFYKNSSKVNKDVHGYMYLDCNGCCINGCTNLCTSCSNFCSWLLVMN